MHTEAPDVSKAIWVNLWPQTTANSPTKTKQPKILPLYDILKQWILLPKESENKISGTNGSIFVSLLAHQKKGSESEITS